MAIQRAKAQAARIGLKYAEEENLVLKRKAQLKEQQKLSAAKKKTHIERFKQECEAELKLLDQRKTAAEEDAALNALELEAEEQGPVVYRLPRDTIVSQERTADYVEARRLNFTPEPTASRDHHDQDIPVCDTEPANEHVDNHIVASASHPAQNQLSEFTRFLLKKDLLMCRLKNVSDHPESYSAWKAKFKSVMKELKVSTEEEIYLMIKYLGPESSKHANSIKISNVNNPTRGLKRVWQRLDERYGSPEMMELALKQKLFSLPKLTNKDNKSLYELCDILSEVEAGKEDEKYAELLSYFDSSAGILPVLNKLPYSIQEKWTNHAVNYKKKQNVTFPPFSVFVKFMRENSIVQNDLSFQYDGLQPSTEKSPFARTKNFQVMTKKTISLQQVQEKPDKECPLHNTEHSLNDCRAFRAKPIEERRRVVKENDICFKCCESTKHARKTCRTEVKCAECDSNTHPPALHVSSQLTRTHKMAEFHGGEQRRETGITVESKCTQICRDVHCTSNSCSKTVLVKVYCEESPENAVKLYAIIDDQSNRSLVKSELLDTLQFRGGLVNYVLTSCVGSLPSKGRRATGLIIQSLNGSTHLKLPTLIECNNIPDVRSEIPTPDVARSYPHLLNIARFIPDLDDSSDTLLLIGRDLLEAYHVLDQRLGPRNTPYA